MDCLFFYTSIDEKNEYPYSSIISRSIMGDIPQFPEEIFHSIFAYCDVKTLLSVRLVCKQFNELATSAPVHKGNVNTLTIDKMSFASIPLVDAAVCRFILNYNGQVLRLTQTAMTMTNNKISDVVIEGPNNIQWFQDDPIFGKLYGMLCGIKKLEIHDEFPPENFSAMKSLEEVVWTAGRVPFDMNSRLRMITELPNLKKLTLKLDEMPCTADIYDISLFKDILNRKKIHLVIDTVSLTVGRLAMFDGVKKLTIFTGILISTRNPHVIPFADHEELDIRVGHIGLGDVFVFSNVKQLVFHDPAHRFFVDNLILRNPKLLTRFENQILIN